MLDGSLSLISSKLSPTEFVNICSNEIPSFEVVKNLDLNENESNSTESYEIVCESSISTNNHSETKEFQQVVGIRQNQKNVNPMNIILSDNLNLQDSVSETTVKDSKDIISENATLEHCHQNVKNISQREIFEKNYLQELDNDSLKGPNRNIGEQLQSYLKYLIDYHSVNYVKHYSKSKIQQEKPAPSSQMVINGSFGSPSPIVMTQAQRLLVLLERSFFCEYYCLITTGVSFLKTNEKNIPVFLKEIFGFYNDIEAYRNALKQFTYLIKNRQKFVLSVDFTKLSNKSQKTITNNLSGYTCIKCFLNFVPKKKMTKSQFNALVIAYQMAKSPYNWKLCGLTRSKKVTEVYGSINANLYDLFIKIATADQIKQMGSVFNKYVQKIKCSDGKYITWNLWKDDFICSVDDIISKSDASFYGWTDPVLKDCALSIRDQTFKLYGHLIN